MKNNKRLIIGIDVDGVLRDINTRLVSLHNEVCPQDFCRMKPDDVYTYNVNEQYPMIRKMYGIEPSKYFFDDMAEFTLGYPHALPYPAVLRTIIKMSYYADIYIVTKQGNAKSKSITAEWLGKTRISDYVKGILFFDDKSEFKGDVLIDDYIPNIEGSDCKFRILIDQPYNRQESSKRFEEFAQKDIWSAHNLPDAWEKIKIFFDIEEMIS